MPGNLKETFMWFAGLTIANVISTAASIDDFPYESAPIRAGIATTFAYVVGKIASK